MSAGTETAAATTPNGMRLVAMTGDRLERMGRLRERLAIGDVPREIAFVRAQLAAAERRAHALFVLFGGQVDQASVDEAVFWKIELDGAYLRATDAC